MITHTSTEKLLIDLPKVSKQDPFSNCFFSFKKWDNVGCAELGTLLSVLVWFINQTRCKQLFFRTNNNNNNNMNQFGPNH